MTSVRLQIDLTDAREMAKLLPYQVPAKNGLVSALRVHDRALDCSDTGIGKTYQGIAAALELGAKPLVVCPLSVIPSWRKVLKLFGAQYYGITNYESLVNCKWCAGESLVKTECPFITKLEDKGPQMSDDIKLIRQSRMEQIFKKTATKDCDPETEKQKKYTYRWNVPADCLVIFDEAHRCKNLRTLNSTLLRTLATTPARILMLSATICDKPELFAIFGWVLKLYPQIKDWDTYFYQLGGNLSALHRVLFPQRAVRVRIKDLGDLFPKCQTIAEPYSMETAVEIQEQYAIIEAAVEKLQSKEDNSGSALAKILYARMKIEALKIPTLIDMAQSLQEQGISVPIFVNFTETLQTLAQELGTECLIYGQQTPEERERAIADFNSDRSHLIVCNIRSGGVGISLHDMVGDRPRVALISPSFSAQDIIQVLGRVHRANGKTPVIQRLIYAADTIEVEVCKNVREKITNIALLNDGDTDAYAIEGMTIDPGAGTPVTEEELHRLKLETLYAKRDRLIQSLKETEEQISQMTGR